MTTYLEIKSICAREILDSRGNPTVETDMALLNQARRQCPPVPVQGGSKPWSFGTGSPGISAWACSTP